MKIERRKCCVLCGFPVDIKREPVILDSSIFSFIHYHNNTCESCGHQLDGSTIPVVHRFVAKISSRLKRERDSIWKFIQEYHGLTDDEKESICIEIPNFMRPNHVSNSLNLSIDDMLVPYSWNVVWLEVKCNTKFARLLVKEWYSKQKNV